MRCRQAQSQIDELRFGTTDAIDTALREHLAKCSKCAVQLDASRAISMEMRQEAAAAKEALPEFETLRTQVSNRSAKRRTTPIKASFIRRLAARPLLAGLPLTAALLALFLFFSPFERAHETEYEIAVAGVSESMLASGSISRLFAAVGLPDVKFEIGDCQSGCSVRVRGLKDKRETRLALAALQKIPHVVIQSVDSFVDRQTGREITRMSTTSRTGIDDNRRWNLELGSDSSVDVQVSIALDSLLSDSTFKWQESMDGATTKTTGVQEAYTVHPDGSYSNSLFANPVARMAWREHRWTYDSTGTLTEYLIVDTSNNEHQINFRNWVVEEQQLKEVGIYYMITYDENGTPWHTATNVDPSTIPGYESSLPAGCYLNQNSPNPFDSLTRITFVLTAEAPVKLVIYGTNSAPVRTLIDSTLSAGEHSVIWDSRSDAGKRLWSFRYLCKLQVGDNYQTIVMSQRWPEKTR